MPDINKVNQVTPLQRKPETVASKGKPTSGTKPFEQVLTSELQRVSDSVKLSGHAQKRLADRHIELTEQDLARIGEGMTRAEQKGGRESLVLLDDLALVVSVKNRTVITAVDDQNLKESVFTNIDSAVIV